MLSDKQPLFAIKDYTAKSFDGVCVATMHRVKGLEFQYVFVVAVNKRVVPLASAINCEDPVAESEAITAEKCLYKVIPVLQVLHFTY